jgi:hypothetical protein
MAVTMKNVVFLDVTRAALVRTDVSGELNITIIRVTRIGAIGNLTITSNRSRMLRNIMYMNTHTHTHTYIYIYIYCGVFDRGP